MAAPKLINELNYERKDMGRGDTLRFNVLTYVVEEQYDRAIECLDRFLVSDFEYPHVLERSERFVAHARDLVSAIRVKRSFPGVQSLTMAKQRELNDKYRRHFEELQLVLKKIEKIQAEQKLDDLRSTVWIVKSLAYCVLFLLFLALVIDIKEGLAFTVYSVVDDYFSQVSRWMF